MLLTDALRGEGVEELDAALDAHRAPARRAREASSRRRRRNLRNEVLAHRDARWRARAGAPPRRRRRVRGAARRGRGAAPRPARAPPSGSAAEPGGARTAAPTRSRRSRRPCCRRARSRARARARRARRGRSATPELRFGQASHRPPRRPSAATRRGEAPLELRAGAGEEDDDVEGPRQAVCADGHAGEALREVRGRARARRRGRPRRCRACGGGACRSTRRRRRSWCSRRVRALPFARIGSRARWRAGYPQPAWIGTRSRVRSTRPPAWVTRSRSSAVGAFGVGQFAGGLRGPRGA